MQRKDLRGSSRAAVVLAGAIFLGGSAWAQANDTNSIPDAQVEANVLKALAGAPQLANENISTNTVYGTVTISGSVKDETTRQMAENLVARADGVKKVVDELTLGAGSPAGVEPEGGAPAVPGGADNQQHAPDPDTYAAQHGYTGQSAPPDDQMSTNGQPNPPDYGQPNGANNTPQRNPAYGQQPGPGNGYGQQPYPPAGYAARPANAPPPYGAQVGGQPVTIPAGAMLRIRINEGLDSKHSQPGTPFDALVLNDVVAGGAVAIPRGASVQGVVVDSKSGGVLKGHGELALKLTQVTLGGKTFPVISDVWQRDSSDKSLQTVNSAIGLGAAGAIIGAIAGGGAGAAIGAGVGGAAGVGTSAASGSRQVLVPPEAILTFHLTQPTPITTVSQAEMDRLSSGVPAGGMRRRYPPPPPAYYGYGYPRPYYPYPY